MEKNRLLLIPFVIGILLMLYSWFSTYPLSVDSVDDSLFNHISLWYWVSLALLFPSIFFIQLSFKNRYVKWLICVTFVLLIYSLFFFYYTLPGSDSHYFRGLTQNFVNTNNLDAHEDIRNYYQWPSFFILAKLITSIGGIDLNAYFFILFAVIGFLLSTTLFVYFSKFNNRLSFFSVAFFFLVIFYFLNYQAVPFSLASGLLFILYMLETKENRSSRISLVIILLFTSITFSHAFVPLFYVLYLFLRSILNKSKWHFGFFIICLLIYLCVQLTFAQFSFEATLRRVFLSSSEYGSLVSDTLAGSYVETDLIPRLLSRFVTIGFALLGGFGFVFVFIKRKLSNTDKSVLLSGLIYSAMGLVLYSLGSRAIPIALIPVSVGIMYLFTNKFGKYAKAIFLVLLVLFISVPLHTSFNSFPITYQTKEAQATQNFLIDRYDWTSRSSIFSDNGAKWYVSPQIPSYFSIDLIDDMRLYNLTMVDYDCVVYSIDVKKGLELTNDSSLMSTVEIMGELDALYSSGSSFIFVKPD